MTSEEFDAMGAAERRVAIARDVKCQIAAGNITPEHMLYVRIPTSEPLEPGFMPTDCALLASDLSGCRACALGSMMVSAIKGSTVPAQTTKFQLNRQRFSQVKPHQAFGYLGKYFEISQLRDIESAFEGGDISTHRFGKSPLAGLPPDARINLLMDNIIRNNGTYVADDKVMLAEAATKRTKGA